MQKDISYQAISKAPQQDRQLTKTPDILAVKFQQSDDS
jgi:hypothetical protein